MKKLMLVVVLFAFAAMVNAQEKKEMMKDSKKTEMNGQKPTKMLIKETDLLQPIKDDITIKYAGAKIDKAWKLETKDNYTYKVLITLDNVKWDLIYNKDGKFIKKTKSMMKEDMENNEMYYKDEPKK